MASRNHIKFIAESMPTDSNWHRTKIPTPTNARQAFLINTTPQGQADMCVVELKDGRVDVYCPTLHNHTDVFGFRNIQHFEEWFDVMIADTSSLFGDREAEPAVGPHTAIAASIGSNYIKG